MSSPRVVEYFLVVGHGSTLDAIFDHQSSTPPTSFLDLLYKGRVVDRVPAADHPSVPFPPGIAMFCIPNDIRLLLTPDLPSFYFFAATQANGIRLYGASLKFYEPVEPSLVAKLMKIDAELKSGKSRDESTTMYSQGGSRNETSMVDATFHQEENSLGNGGNTPIGERGSNVDGPKEKGNGHSSLTVATTMNITARKSDESSQSEQSHSPSVSLSLRRHSVSNSNSNAVHPPSISSALTATPISPTALSNILSTSSKSVTDKEKDTNGRKERNKEKEPPAPLPVVWAPKCICILSVHPFLSQFREFLTEFYRMSLTPCPLPLERWLCNFMFDIPLPPRGEIRLHYKINEKSVFFAQPPPNNPIQFTHFPMKLLFECLEVENVVFLVESLLIEKRILLLSTRMSSLTVIAETLLHLIFPFEWRHVYIPLLPKALLDFLFAPMPYIIGMHFDYVKDKLSSSDFLNELIVVDLDKNFIYNHKNVMKTHIMLPSKERKKLLKALKQVNLYKSEEVKNEYEKKTLDSMDLAFANAPAPDEVEQAESRPVFEIDGIAVNEEAFITASFFRCFVSMFKDYKASIIAPTELNPHPDPCFELTSFLKHHESSSHLFYREFATTQAFTAFVEDRIFVSGQTAVGDNKSGKGSSTVSSSASFSTDSKALTPPGTILPSSVDESFRPVNSSQSLYFNRKLANLRFFDESIVAKRNRSKFSKRLETPFLTDKSFEITECVDIPSPETANLTANKKYIYTTFPIMDVTLFSQPRAPLLSAATRKGVAQLPTSASSTALPSSGSSISVQSNDLSAVRLNKLRMAPPKGSHMSMLNTLITLWFTLVTSLACETRQVHVLSTALKVLLNLRCVGYKPEEDVFLQLMKACGACRQADKSIDVLMSMTECGIKPSADVYQRLLQAFTVNGDHKGYEALIKLKLMSGGDLKEKEKDKETLKKLAVLPTSPAIKSPSSSSASSSSASTPTSPVLSPTGAGVIPAFPLSPAPQNISSPMSASSNPSPSGQIISSTTGRLSLVSSFLETSFQLLPRSNDSLPPSSSSSPSASPPSSGPPSPPIMSSSLLSPTHAEVFLWQKCFRIVFPNLIIDTTDYCPECNHPLDDAEVRGGWSDKSNDYTTACGACGERFVPRFAVRLDDAFTKEKEAQVAVSQPSSPPNGAQTATALSASAGTSPASSPSPSLPTSSSASGHNLTLPSIPRNASSSISSSTPLPSPSTLKDIPLQTSLDSRFMSSKQASLETYPIYCEYLPVRVLKKEIHHLVEESKVQYLCSPRFRLQSHTLYWNLCWHLSTIGLPLQFLFWDFQSIRMMPEMSYTLLPGAFSVTSQGSVGLLRSICSLPPIIHRMGLSATHQKRGGSGGSAGAVVGTKASQTQQPLSIKPMLKKVMDQMQSANAQPTPSTSSASEKDPLSLSITVKNGLSKDANGKVPSSELPPTVHPLNISVDSPRKTANGVASPTSVVVDLSSPPRMAKVEASTESSSAPTSSSETSAAAVSSNNGDSQPSAVPAPSPSPSPSPSPIAPTLPARRTSLAAIGASFASRLSFHLFGTPKKSEFANAQANGDGESEKEKEKLLGEDKPKKEEGDDSKKSTTPTNVSSETATLSFAINTTTTTAASSVSPSPSPSPFVSPNATLLKSGNVKMEKGNDEEEEDDEDIPFEDAVSLDEVQTEMK